MSTVPVMLFNVCMNCKPYTNLCTNFQVLSGAKLENYRAHLSVEAAEPHRKVRNSMLTLSLITVPQYIPHCQRANASERELDDLRE